MTHHRKLRMLLLFACASISSTITQAATYYVSNSGSNTHDGLSWANAWLTLQYAADQVVAGDSVWIADGQYAGFDLRTSGAAGAYIVFIAAGSAAEIDAPNPVTPDGINVENADYIEIRGLRVVDQPRNGIRLVFADFCIVRHTYCDNNFERGIFTGFTDDILIEYNECLNSIDEHGIYVSNSSDRSIIRYNTCHHNNRGGIQINADASQGGDGVSTDPQIYGNILYENGLAGGAAINLDGVQGALIYNNVIFDNHATGIALFQQDGGGPSTDASILHNTIVQASDARWCILIVNGATGAQVYNNILINQHPWRGSIALDPDAIPGFNSDYNIVVNSLSNQGDGVSLSLAQWQGLGYDLHSLLAAPLDDLFVAYTSGDFHLAPGAQAIDAGSGALAGTIDEDIEGTLRPQFAEHDIGAYESAAPLSIGDDPATPPTRPFPPAFRFGSETIAWPSINRGTLLICAFDGRVVFQASLEVAGIIHTGHWPAGMYLAIGGQYGDWVWVQSFLVPGR